MAQSINWDLLEDQYLSDGQYREKLSKMVTIVDEAFLAGKKFARTYSQTVDTTEQTINSERSEKLDITFKEKLANVDNTKISDCKKASTIVDVSKNVLDINKVPKSVVRIETLAQIENLNAELKRLLDENKISEVLYEKLSSNETFVLEPQDIEDINNLTENTLKEVLLKCKIGEWSFCTFD